MFTSEVFGFSRGFVSLDEEKCFRWFVLIINSCGTKVKFLNPNSGKYNRKLAQYKMPPYSQYGGKRAVERHTVTRSNGFSELIFPESQSINSEEIAARFSNH